MFKFDDFLKQLFCNRNCFGDFLKTLLFYFVNFDGSYAVSILKVLQNLEVSCLKLSSHIQKFDLTDLCKSHCRGCEHGPHSNQLRTQD